MKVVGIYFIIVGHFFPIGNQYVYVFSVPLFFIISGYLSRREETGKVFWRKTWERLVLPSCILVCVNQMPSSVLAITRSEFTFDYFASRWLSGIYGGGLALGALWFVYTLIICKAILQYVRSGFALLVLNALCVLASVVYLRYGIAEWNGILNVAVSLPFVTLGFFAKRYREILNREHSKLALALVGGLMLGIVVVVKWLNGAPWMFENCYGKDFGVFMVGGVAGTVLMYCVSKMLGGYTSKTLVMLSNGTLVILAWHGWLIRLCRLLPFAQKTFLDYGWALLVLLAFIPILMFCHRYCKVLVK
ncbi:MAG: acyltransferase family protein [Bacteroidaceae bacterium]|nr:acyltransferase family protein [Bacteroidaceae bacterium]